MELGWGGFDRAKLDMIRIPFSFHVFTQLSVLCLVALLPRQAESSCVWVWHVFSCRYLIFIWRLEVKVMCSSSTVTSSNGMTNISSSECPSEQKC